MKGIVFLLLMALVAARYFETSLKFSLFGRNEGWVYVDKMTFAPGTARVELETSTSGIPYSGDNDLFLQAIPEDKWETESTKRCEQQIRPPVGLHRIRLDGQTTSSTFAFNVQDYTTYFLVLKDCQKHFHGEYTNGNLLLSLKLHLVNNGREVGEEEDHWYIVPFIVVAGMALVHFYMQEFRVAGPRDPDWSKMLLFIGTVAQVSSLFWKSIGFVIYCWTGADYFFFHLIYLLLHSCSQAAVVGLVVLIGFGWTLTFSYGKYFQIFIPLVGCLAFINIIITIVTKIGHEHDRHHLFDSVGGSILIVFRIILTLVFLLGCFRTYRRMRASLKHFMGRFVVLGLLYIGSMPGVVLLANSYVPARNRHEFVFICIEVIKFSANLVLGYQMNVEASEYNRVNYKNASFIPEEEVGF